MEPSHEKRTLSRFINTFKVEISLLLYILFSIGRLGFRFVTEIAQFNSIFESMNVELPVLTQSFLSLAVICREWWMVGLVPALILVGAGAAAILIILGTKVMNNDDSIVGPIVFGGLILSVIFFFALDSLITMVMYMPMLGLVNSVG